MENLDFKISNRLVWALFIGGFTFTLTGFLTKVTEYNFSDIFLIIGIILSFTAWIIIINDMTKNNIYNKTFWIMSMFILPTLASIFYLIQRNKLIRLGNSYVSRF